MRKWLSRRHSVEWGILTAVLVLYGYAIIGMVAGMFFRDSFEIESGWKIGVLGVAGSVFGLLLASAALTVQIEQDHSDPSSVFANYRLRDYGVYWILGIALGILAGNALVPVWIGRLVPIPMGALDLLNAVAVPVASGLGLVSIGSALRQRAHSPWRGIPFALRADLEETVSLAKGARQRWSEFERLCNETRHVSPPYMMSARHRDPVKVFDVRLDSLLTGFDEPTFSSLVRLAESNLNVSVEFRILSEVQGRYSVILWGIDENQSHVMGPKLPNSERRASGKRREKELSEAERLARRVFTRGTLGADVVEDLNEFASGLGRLTERAASHNGTVEFGEALGGLEDFLALWLKYLGTESASSHGRSLSGALPIFSAPLTVDFYLVGETIVSRNDKAKIRILLKFFARLFRAARRSRNYHLGIEVGQWIESLNYQMLTNEALIRAQMATVDQVIYEMGVSRNDLHSEMNESEQQSFADIALGSLLRVIVQSLEADQSDVAEYYYMRIRMTVNSRFSFSGAPEPEEEWELRVSVLALFSWSTFLNETVGPNSAATAVMNLSAEDLPGIEGVVRTYEALFAGNDSGASSVAERLRFANWRSYWEIPDRPGEWNGSSYDPDAWLRRGALAAMLACDPEGRMVVSEQGIAPPDLFWSIDSIERDLESLAPLVLRGTPQDQRRSRIEAILSVLRTRELIAKKNALASLANSEVSEELRALYIHAATEPSDKDGLFATLSALELSPGTAAIQAESRSLEQLINRDDLNRKGIVYAGEGFSRFIGSHSCAALLDLLENHCESGDVLHLLELSLEVARQSSSIREGGGAPNLIVVPRGLLQILVQIGIDDFSLTQNEQFDATWNGAGVIGWPAGDMGHVFVMDTSLLLSKVGFRVVSLSDIEEGDRTKFLRDVGAAIDLSSLPNVKAIRATGKCELSPEFAIHDSAGGRVIKLDRMERGRWKRKGDVLVHESSCDLFGHVGRVDLVLADAVLDADANLPACRKCNSQLRER